MKPLPCLLFVTVLAACGVPHPPPHGPVPAPVAITTNAQAVLSEMRRSYPQARLDVSTGPDAIRFVFGPGPGVTSADSFARSFVSQYAERLGAGVLGDSFGGENGSVSVRSVLGFPPRDSGCRRVVITLEIAANAPTWLERACDRFTRPPPSYRARKLPSTSSANVDVVARVGSVGGIAGPLFSGYAMDRYGDVYEAADGLPEPSGGLRPAFLREYVKTLPAEEVEQFAFDASRSAAEPELPEESSGIPDGGGAVVQAFLPGHANNAIELDRRAGSGASRATAWARRNIGR